jgi:small subunit ribosomal protein S17
MAEIQNESERGSRKVRVGTVLSERMEKTVIVGVERRVAHRLYGKQVTRTKKYYAHDEEGQARQGDTVRIMETRPLSKTKRWRLVEIVERAK